MPMHPASDRRAMPWRIAFSTRCWRAKLGIAAERSDGSTSISTRSRSEHLAQLLDDARRLGAVAVAHQHVDRIQAVEEKVRIHPGLERGQLGAGELLGHARELHFTIARFDEVPCRVLDADHAEIDGDTE